MFSFISYTYCLSYYLFRDDRAFQTGEKSRSRTDRGRVKLGSKHDLNSSVGWQKTHTHTHEHTHTHTYLCPVHSAASGLLAATALSLSPDETALAADGGGGRSRSSVGGLSDRCCGRGSGMRACRTSVNE